MKLWRCWRLNRACRSVLCLVFCGPHTCGGAALAHWEHSSACVISNKQNQRQEPRPFQENYNFSTWRRTFLRWRSACRGRCIGQNIGRGSERHVTVALLHIFFLLHSVAFPVKRIKCLASTFPRWCCKSRKCVAVCSTNQQIHKSTTTHSPTLHTNTRRSYKISGKSFQQIPSLA